MSNLIVDTDPITEAKQQIFDVLLTLPPNEQNQIIKDLRQSFIEYRYKKMKEAETTYKNCRDLFHDISS